MSDSGIVERLRQRHRDQYPMPGGQTLFTEAADEIERLRAAWDASIAERDDLRNTRNAALEEAAKVAEDREDDSDTTTAKWIAADIRALKEKS